MFETITSLVMATSIILFTVALVYIVLKDVMEPEES